MTDQPLEERLRATFQREAVGVAAPRELASVAIRQARRSGRSRHLVATIAATAAVIAVGGFTVQALAPDAQTTDPAGPTSASPQASERRGDTQTSAFEWAQGLPRGEPVGTPLLVGTTLTVGEKTIPLRADDAGLIGGVDGGTLVLLEEDRPTGFTSRLTVVASDGSQTILPQLPYATQDEVISPDGTMVAYSSKVYDLNTQSFVAGLPANAGTLLSWSDAGIVYSSKSAADNTFLWRPGDEPQHLAAFAGTVQTAGNYGVASKDGCSEVIRLERDASITSVLKDCADGVQFASVSPNGSYALTSDYSVVDIDTGTRRSISNLSSNELGAGTFTVRWTSDSTVLFVAEEVDSASDEGHESIIVRCDAPSVSCERASDAVQTTRRDIIQIQ